MTTTPPTTHDVFVTSGPPMRTSNDGRIEVHTPCLFCGYNLLGLNRADRCPECAEPADISVYPILSKLWGQRVAANTRRGVKLQRNLLTIAIPAGIFGAYFGQGTDGVLPAILLITWTIATSVAWWLIATPGKLSRFAAPALCWTTRVAAVLYPLLVCGYLYSAYTWTGPFPPRKLWLITLFCIIITGPLRLLAGLMVLRDRLPKQPGSGRKLCTAAISIQLAMIGLMFLSIIVIFLGPLAGVPLCIGTPLAIAQYIILLTLFITLTGRISTRQIDPINLPTTFAPPSTPSHGEHVP